MDKRVGNISIVIEKRGDDFYTKILGMTEETNAMMNGAKILMLKMAEIVLDNHQDGKCQCRDFKEAKSIVAFFEQ